MRFLSVELCGAAADAVYRMQGLTAATPHERAKVDLKFHFTKSTLMQNVRSHASIRNL